MKVADNEVLVYHQDGDSRAEKVVAYARTITGKIHEIDWERNTFDSFNWKQILEMLNVTDMNDILNHDHAEYKRLLEGKGYEFEDMVHIVTHHPEMIKGPIAIRGKKAVICEDPKKVLTLS